MQAFVEEVKNPKVSCLGINRIMSCRIKLNLHLEAQRNELTSTHGCCLFEKILVASANTLVLGNFYFLNPLRVNSFGSFISSDDFFME